MSFNGGTERPIRRNIIVSSRYPVRGKTDCPSLLGAFCFRGGVSEERASDFRRRLLPPPSVKKERACKNTNTRIGGDGRVGDRPNVDAHGPSDRRAEQGVPRSAIVGVVTRGNLLAKRLAHLIERIEALGAGDSSTSASIAMMPCRIFPLRFRARISCFPLVARRSFWSTTSSTRVEPCARPSTR